MDWSKAKNILIIAFIITNVFLVYVLINSRSIDAPMVGEGFIEDVKVFLLEKDIKLAVEIPRNIPSLPLFSMKYETYDPQDIANKFLGENYTTETIKGNVYYIDNGKKVAVRNGNEIIYEDEGTRHRFNSLTTQMAKDLAEEFIKDMGFDLGDYRLSIATYKEGAYYIEYTKIIDDYYFEKSYMRFNIGLTGINKFERYWIESAEPYDSTKITIMSAPRALLKLLTMEEIFGKTIEDISICYYLDPQKYIGASDPRNTKGGKAAPVWRIVFNDGTKIFLEDN